MYPVLCCAIILQQYEESNRVRYEKVNGTVLVKEMADTLGEILGKKVEGLRVSLYGSVIR